jgi:uncharacterized protein
MTDVDSLAQSLEAAFHKIGPCMVAYSGGVDSALLAHVAHRVLGEDMVAVLATGSSLSQRERDGAQNFAAQHGIPLKTIETEEMSKEGYVANEGQRCYYCKQALFEKLSTLKVSLKGHSQEMQWPVVYGVNQDDLGDYRPGLKAAKEAEVCSPYLELKMGKAEIRALASFYGLSVADKPAMPCLASRIPHGEVVNPKKLSQVEQAEDLLYGLGLSICRVRHHGDVARIEVLPKEMPWILEHRESVESSLLGLGFKFVSLDLKGFRSGALNEALDSQSSIAATIVGSTEPNMANTNI